MAIVCIEFEVKTVKLNERLISLRKDKRMSQQDLAEALNVSRQAVSRWEVGIAIPSMDNLLALSKLFGVPTDELMGAIKLSASRRVKRRKAAEIERDALY